jgi:hypothetical protein
MADLISFRTAAFDPALEPENPINPIAGQSVLAWLRANALGSEYESTPPDYEDWGWYIEVRDADTAYTVGAICYDEGGSGDVVRDWMIQVVPRRRLSDVFRRRMASQGQGRLTGVIADALRADGAFEDVSVEQGR